MRSSQQIGRCLRYQSVLCSTWIGWAPTTVGAGLPAQSALDLAGRAQATRPHGVWLLLGDQHLSQTAWQPVGLSPALRSYADSERFDDCDSAEIRRREQHWLFFGQFCLQARKVRQTP